jgi:hypothetical protein
VIPLGYGPVERWWSPVAVWPVLAWVRTLALGKCEVMFVVVPKGWGQVGPVSVQGGSVSSKRASGRIGVLLSISARRRHLDRAQL